MNITPSIFKEQKHQHTIIGGSLNKNDEQKSDITLVLLNRGGRYYRSSVFQKIEQAGFTSVISIEMSEDTYDIESLSTRFPSVTFLLTDQSYSIGERISTAIAETKTSFIFTIWNDMRIPSYSAVQKIVQRMSLENSFCVAPVLTNQRMEALPVQMVPALQKNVLVVEPMPCIRDNSPTIYPCDFAGVFSREKYLALGGYDYSIKNPYWQNLDLGFRSFLCGEKISIASSFRIVYETEVPREDISTDSFYFLFFLKNLAPRMRSRTIELSRLSFFSYMRKSRKSFFISMQHFTLTRQWLHEHQSFFIRDAASLVKNWEPYL